MTRLRISAVLLMLCAASASAQLYKWVGPDGKVTYSDVPPPSSARQVETKSVTAGIVNAAGLPYELAEAVKANPVTLYTTGKCIPCDDGRRLLSERGIPFAEKTVNSNEDFAQLRKAGGKGQLPLLSVGRLKEEGFAAGVWNNVLTAAGYPESSKLPKSYRNSPAEAAALPVPPKTADAKDSANADRSTEPPRATELPPATGNAPPGFRF